VRATCDPVPGKRRSSKNPADTLVGSSIATSNPDTIRYAAPNTTTSRHDDGNPAVDSNVSDPEDNLDGNLKYDN
jgi:hypothetical protein